MFDFLSLGFTSSGTRTGNPISKHTHLRKGEMTMRFIAIAAFVFTVAFAVTTQSAFGQHPVDPNTLNPPPPPEFNPICKDTGNGTVCTVQFSDPPFAGGSGVICTSGGTTYEVFQFQNRSVLGHRYYDRSGNLLRRHYREVLSGTFSNPLNGAAVSFSGGDTHLHDLAVPGDISSGTEVMTGSFRINKRQGGSVLVDTGRQVVTEDGTLVSESGQHPFNDYFIFGNSEALQPLCDALQ